MQDEVTQALEYSRMADPEAWVNADAGKHSPENNARLAQANTTGKARYLFELLAGFSQSQFVQAAASEGGENLLNALVGVLGGFPAHRHQAERETLARMEPVAWMYEREGSSAHVSLARVKSTRDAFWGWTETPLYALPPAPEAGQ